LNNLAAICWANFIIHVWRLCRAHAFQLTWIMKWYEGMGGGRTRPNLISRCSQPLRSVESTPSLLSPEISSSCRAHGKSGKGFFLFLCLANLQYTLQIEQYANML
jgi:hypothetical protein